MKNIYFIILSVLIIIYIIYSVRKKKLSVKTSFGWVMFCFASLFLSIWPKSLDWLANFLGITYPPALFLTLCVIIILLIDFSYSKKIEIMQKEIIDLAQELSIIKGEVKDDKQKESKSKRNSSLL